jgi:predicted component of type VI protein secretion system
MLTGFSNPQQQEWFARFWGIANKGTPRQLTAMLYLLPIATRIVGNRELTARCFKTVLGERVSITYGAPVKYDIREYLTPLGKARLGVDMVTGNELQEGIPSIEVAIGPLKQGKVLQYLPGAKSGSVLDMLFRYFLPVTADVQTTILVQKEDRDFTLSEEAYTSRLGFTSGI